jgi:hypothetical protein
MAFDKITGELVREQLAELLQGGFAPVIPMLREFDYQKAGIVLDGLHFSAWILLGHMKARQAKLLYFMKDPETTAEIWPDAHWPENHLPASDQEWQEAISGFEQDLDDMIKIVKDPESHLFEVHRNGKTLSWAALTTLHHNAYHIGQLKTIGRQLGVW